ncbi:MAG: D-alanyl-D-alanine carboxypeptidase [Alphaproteobacteria bacterium]|nr:D-alanyl-D-alanine carboxypeptidase [Alphaproteobacteria bacterium]
MSRCRPNLFVSISVIILVFIYSPLAEAFSTSAKQVLLVDYETGETLFEKNADELMSPASMSKIMTVYLAFEALKKGHLKLEDTITVSEKAWRKGGSRMFLNLDSQVSVADIIRGIIVQSGNDAAIALAEHLEGSEEEFSEMMTLKAKELGLDNSTFKNATGWPDPDHRMTARDLSKLAMLTIRNFPDFYSIYSETDFVHNKIKQRNRNPLLYKGMGSDGLKTGHTKAAGYGLTASVERSGRRLILVINGLKSARKRTIESQRIIEWGFRTYTNYKLFSPSNPVVDIDVWLGESKTIPAYLNSELTLTLKRSNKRKMKLSVKYDEPITAPISKGQTLGILRVEIPGKNSLEYPLISSSNIKQLGPFNRIAAAMNYLIWGSGD